MEVRLVDPSDEDELAEWAAVLQASEKDFWPDLTGFTLPDVRAFARHRSGSKRFELLAAREAGGPILGVGMMELPLRDNLGSAEVTVAVHPAHRRRGVGTAIVEAMRERGQADGRLVLNLIDDVPIDRAADYASLSFAPKVGFEAMLSGNTRHLAVPIDAACLDELRAEVARARDADAYRVLTFEAPWPAEHLQDQCALFQCMSTDEPHGDEGHEEEVWDAERVRENDDLRAARGCRFLIAVAQHIASGRLVACTELSIAVDSPGQAWQMLTVVEPAHRGHRLGLAVKLANLDALARSAPAVQLIVTGNASVNAPMIAVNDLMGFEVAGFGYFWQKRLASAHLGGAASGSSKD
ncbi:MAG TPA: GNAT family N-acetyltransferase [Acidimicrobiales bacterium]|nr:GNAT family N-acetyltransferase [Acidimicrobiales bacterium]